MKFLLSIGITMLLSFSLCLFLPWWSVAIAALAVAMLIPQSHLMSFFTGFCGLFVLWGVMCFIINAANDSILAKRVSLLILKTDNAFLLIILTALIGGVIAGLAALSGSFIRLRENEAVT